jgi:hypothetical protein
MAGFSERIKLTIDVVTGNASGPLKQLSSDLRAADGAFKKTSVAAGGLFDYLKRNAAVAAVGVGTALAAMGAKAVTAFQDTALGAGQLADSLGTTTEEASRLQEVAGDLGIGVGTIETAIGRMNKAAQTTPAAFDAIGAAIKKNADGTTNVNATFLSTIDALNRIPDATQRAAAASKIFGRGWQDMAQLIEMGAQGVSEAMASVEEGKIIDPAEVAKAREYRDAMDELKGSFEEFMVVVGGQLAPALAGAAEKLSGFFKTAEDFTNSNAWAFLSGDYEFEGLGMGNAAVHGALSDALVEEADSAYAAYEAFGRLGGVADATMGSTVGLTGIVNESALAAEDAAAAAGEEAEALRDAAAAARESADAHTAEADALFATINARRAAADAQFAVNDANRGFAESLADYSTLVSSGEASMTQLAEAQEGVVSSAAGAADAAARLAQEQAAATGGALTAAQSGDIWRDSMIAQAGAAGDLAGPILDYVATVEGIPPEKMTEIKAMVAAGDIAGAQAALDALSVTRTAQIAAEAQVAAATADLEAVTSAQRVADIVAAAWTQAAAEGLDGVAAQERVAEILGQALTGEADSALSGLGPYTPAVIGRYTGTTGVPSSFSIPVRLVASGAVAGVGANGMRMNAGGGTTDSRSVAGETGQIEFVNQGAVASTTFMPAGRKVTGVAESASLIGALTAAVDRLAVSPSGPAIDYDRLARAIGREVNMPYRR